MLRALIRDKESTLPSLPTSLPGSSRGGGPYPPPSHLRSHLRNVVRSRHPAQPALAKPPFSREPGHACRCTCAAPLQGKISLLERRFCREICWTTSTWRASSSGAEIASVDRRGTCRVASKQPTLTATSCERRARPSKTSLTSLRGRGNGTEITSLPSGDLIPTRYAIVS